MSRQPHRRSARADTAPPPDDDRRAGTGDGSDRPANRPPDAADPNGSGSDRRIGSAGGGPYPPATPGERQVSQQ
jgi:hypothetical protein